MSREPKAGSPEEKEAPGATGELQAKLRLLPDAPGVYLHKIKQGKVIYVGKANRLNQLIKEYRPLYNVRLKDDKQYPYIRVSVNEPYPRVSVVRRIAQDGARYFGPFTDVGAMRETLKFAAGAFQVRTCHLDLPGQTVERACLDWQIGRCSAPCVDYDTQESYRDKVSRMVRFLSGSAHDVVEEMREEMAVLAVELRFEEAANLRNLIAKLDRTTSRSRPVSGISGDCDLIGLARDGADASGVVLRVRSGHILTIFQPISCFPIRSSNRIHGRNGWPESGVAAWVSNILNGAPKRRPWNWPEPTRPSSCGK